MSTDLKTTAVVPYYGSNRRLGKFVGEELQGCTWVGVVFAGGMAEIPHISASTLVVNDVHRLVINLASVMKDANLGPKLYRELRRETFCQDALRAAQSACRDHETAGVGIPSFEAARDYFVACWMARSSVSGGRDEFTGQLPIRWNSNGGDSNTRYRSAVSSLVAWRRILARCNFTTLDFRAFLGRCQDAEGIGVYCDPPFPGPGDRYKHTMSDQDHVDLAALLATFTQARVVCRFYDVPLVRRLYFEPLWRWRHLQGRKQTNEAAPEVLLINDAGRGV